VLALHTYKVYWVYDLENATTQPNVGMAQSICITRNTCRNIPIICGKN